MTGHAVLTMRNAAEINGDISGDSRVSLVGRMMHLIFFPSPVRQNQCEAQSQQDRNEEKCIDSPLTSIINFLDRHPNMIARMNAFALSK